MNISQETFISSTMWTDKAGFLASLETLKFMKKYNVQRKIANKGKDIKNFGKRDKKHGINISVSGQDSMPYFKFDYKNNLEISTYFTQEMLKVFLLVI